MEELSKALKRNQSHAPPLERTAARKDQTRQQDLAASPAVGIIFMRGDDLWIDSTPAADAVYYGALKTHEKGHPDFWEELQGRGVVPRDEEYDEVARGRVSFDPKQGTAMLMLDQCILHRPDLVDRIRREMRLPAGAATEVRPDSHYVCPGCRQRPKEDVEEDW